MKVDKWFQERENINEWFKRPKYKIWKYVLIGIAITIVLLIMATIIWMDNLTWQAVMVMRGCAGVLGIFFIAIYAIFYYMAYKDYIQHRYDRRRKR